MIENEKKVIKTLEKNLLFDDYNELDNEISSNKEQDFFKEYRFRDSCNNYFPKKISRDNFGNINLEEIPYLVSNLTGSSCHSKGRWILLSNGSRVYLKEDEYYNQLLELMFQELCKQLKIPCAKYDLVKLGDKVYTASPSFLKTNEYLFDYYNFECKTGNFSGYSDGIKRINLDDLINRSEIINDTDRLLQTIFLDTITKNYDRFPHNYKIIKTKFSYRPAPLFDNGGCCEGIDKFLYHRISVNSSVESEDILFKLASFYNFREWFIQNYNKINIYKIAENIYKKKKIYIESCVYEDFDKIVNDELYIAKESILCK